MYVIWQVVAQTTADSYRHLMLLADSCIISHNNKHVATVFAVILEFALQEQALYLSTD